MPALSLIMVSREGIAVSLARSAKRNLAMVARTMKTLV
jgi:hypothetical protein